MFVVECMGWVCEVMVGDVCGVGMWGDGGYVRRWWVMRNSIWENMIHNSNPYIIMQNVQGSE